MSVTARLPLVDALRGLALWAMVLFHLAWDLAYFGWIDAGLVHSPGFRLFGHVIGASFLLLAGVSLALARRSKGPLLRSRAFWRRWARIVAAAAAIGAVSFSFFPESPIFFGILHCIALSSLIAAPLIGAPLSVVIALGAAGLAAPHFFSAPFFDAPLFWWTGLGTFDPPSNDYRPLLPWLGFMLLGVALARLPLPVLTGRGRGVRGRGEGLDVARASRSSHANDILASPQAPHPCPLLASGESERLAPFMRVLTFCERHSLAFYLIHQPLLFGGLALLSLFVTPAPAEAPFLRNCALACVNQGAEDGLCKRACACMIDRSKAQGFFAELAANRMSETRKAQAHDLAVACYADSAGR